MSLSSSRSGRRIARAASLRLPPALYRVIAEEAHRRGVPVGVHQLKVSDAKELCAGVEGLAARACAPRCG